MMIKDGIDPTSVEGVAKTVYDLPMLAGTLHSPTLAVRPLWWRSVGNTHTAYVMETMIDELAAAAGRDPLAFRLALLGKSPRAAACSSSRPTRRAGASRGAPASRRASPCTSRSIRSSRRWPKCRCATARSRSSAWSAPSTAACAVNPDVIRAQMEGCIGFALGALYYSEIELKAGRAVQRNFDTYRSLRIHEMPKVEVHIVPSTEKPTGVGEPGVPPLAPAVANAVAKLGGPRVRRLPFTRAGLVADLIAPRRRVAAAPATMDLPWTPQPRRPRSPVWPDAGTSRIPFAAYTERRRCTGASSSASSTGTTGATSASRPRSRTRATSSAPWSASAR